MKSKCYYNRNIFVNTVIENFQIVQKLLCFNYNFLCMKFCDSESQSTYKMDYGESQYP